MKKQRYSMCQFSLGGLWVSLGCLRPFGRSILLHFGPINVWTKITSHQILFSNKMRYICDRVSLCYSFGKKFFERPLRLSRGGFSPPKISKNCSKNVQKLNNFLLWWLIELNKILFGLLEIDRLSREKIIFFTLSTDPPGGHFYTQKMSKKESKNAKKLN